jgi:hypothetical protein
MSARTSCRSASRRAPRTRFCAQPRNLRIPIVLDFGNDAIAYLNGQTWSSTLTRSGTYVLSVFGTEQHGEIDVQPFAMRLTIR